MIIVTGASRGLGLEIAKAIVKNGGSVLGIARHEPKDPAILTDKFKFTCCDVSCYDSLKQVANSLKKEKVELEGIINAAGVASMNLAVLTPSHVVDRLIDVNLKGTIFSCQLFAPLLFRKKRGFIINFSTIAVAIGLKGESIYVASKAGIEGFSRAFAREAADFNVRVNCVAPGPIDTDLIRNVGDDRIAKVVSHQVIPHQFGTDDIVNTVMLLCDEKASAISGQVLHVGGA